MPRWRVRANRGRVRRDCHRVEETAQGAPEPREGEEDETTLPSHPEDTGDDDDTMEEDSVTTVGKSQGTFIADTETLQLVQSGHQLKKEKKKLPRIRRTKYTGEL